VNDQTPSVQTIECVAAFAMQLGTRHLADYGAKRSRHDFTQRQLVACLILRTYAKTTYRGVVQQANEKIEPRAKQYGAQTAEAQAEISPVGPVLVEHAQESLAKSRDRSQ
jgi:hypothetical protein